VKNFAITLILPAALAVTGCIDFGTTTRKDGPAKAAIEEVKVAPKPVRKKDVDPSNPNAAIESLEKELDFEASQPADVGSPSGGHWQWNGNGK
jgi:hypothetical protein